MKTITPTGIELFAGCGGLSTGFLDAGLNVAAGFELDARAVDAYNYNHAYRGSRGFIADLNVASGAELLKSAGIKRADFVIGGPMPAVFDRWQAAGQAGHSRRPYRPFHPHRGRIETLCLHAGKRADSCVDLDNGEFLEGVKAELRALGYAVDHAVVLAADFGVPQNRKRLVVLGMKGTKAVRFPPRRTGPTNSPSYRHRLLSTIYPTQASSAKPGSSITNRPHIRQIWSHA